MTSWGNEATVAKTNVWLTPPELVAAELEYKKRGAE